MRRIILLGLLNLVLIFMNRSSSRHQVFSPLKSPKRHEPHYDNIDKTSEYKLNEKIHKLKHALKAAEKHNDELHAKVKHYKDQLHEVSRLHDEDKRYKKKYETLHTEHDKKVLELQELKIKSEYHERHMQSKLKQNYQNKIHSLTADVSKREIKIRELEETTRELSDKVESRNSKIKELQLCLEKNKLRESEDKTSKLNKIQQDLHNKITETHEYSREIAKLKDSLRDSLGKLEKANTLVFEQTQKNKQLVEEQKETKKLVTIIQKETSALREGSERVKVEGLEKSEKINRLEKQMMGFDFERVRLQQKLNELQCKLTQVSKEKELLEGEVGRLESKLQETLAYHYDLQREFERQLHTIVKQLTRRHIVSKSMIGSMGSSYISVTNSPIKGEDPTHH